jgi:hypothetical protein
MKKKKQQLLVAKNIETGRMIGFKCKTTLARIVGCHRNSIKERTVGMTIHGYEIISIEVW